MNKSIQYLAIALVVQCLLLATILFGQSRNQGVDESTLVVFDTDAVDTLLIKDSEGELEIKKQDDLWILPGYKNLPVPDGRVAEVLKDLSELKVSWPVASSDAAAKRFEVGKKNAQKAIKLKSGQEIVSSLFLGTSPGYRKTHARTSGSSKIYAVEFAQHQVSNKHEDWFDKTLLQYTGRVNRVSLPNITIVRSGENWQVSALSEDKLVDASKVQDWVKRFSDLQVSKLVLGDEKDKIVVLDPTFTADIEGESGTSAFIFYQKDETTFVKKAGADELFEIASFQAKPILELDVKEFVLEQPEENAQSEGVADILPENKLTSSGNASEGKN